MTTLTFKICLVDSMQIRTLTQDIIRIGSMPFSTILIDDESVSRMHAVIEVVSPDEIRILDLGSTAGTIVNGKKVNQCSLHDGDELTIGRARITITVGTP